MSFVGSSDIGWFFGTAYLGDTADDDGAAAVAAQSPMAHVGVGPHADPRHPLGAGLALPGRAGAALVRRAQAARRRGGAAALPGRGARAHALGEPEAPQVRFEHVLRWWDTHLPVGADRATGRSSATPHRLMPASTACGSIAASSSSVSGGQRDGGEVLVELLGGARADEHGRDARVAEHPGERELRQRPAAGAGDRVEGAHVGERLVGEPLGAQRAAAGGARVGGDAVQVARAEHALRQRGERDDGHAGVGGDVEQRATVGAGLLDPAVEHRVGGLVHGQPQAERRGRRRGPRRCARPSTTRSPRTAPCPTGRRGRGRRASPRAACSGRTGGCRTRRRCRGRAGAATRRATRAGTSRSRARRTAPATRGSRPWW